MTDSIDPISAAVGRRLREIREAKGMSQDKLAASSGLHRTYIGRVERGEANITIKSFYRICAALDILTTEILAEEFVRRHKEFEAEFRKRREPPNSS